MFSNIISLLHLQQKTVLDFCYCTMLLNYLWLGHFSCINGRSVEIARKSLTF
jgi:regulator of sigma D